MQQMNEDFERKMDKILSQSMPRNSASLDSQLLNVDAVDPLVRAYEKKTDFLQAQKEELERELLKSAETVKLLLEENTGLRQIIEEKNSTLLEVSERFQQEYQ